MPIAIAIKPVPESAVPKGLDAAPKDMSANPDADATGQDIVDQCKSLSEDDLTTLMHGISPEAIEVMEKIPELSAFANWIEHGSTEEESPEAPPGNTGPMKSPTARDQVASAMKANGVRGGY